MISRIFRWLYHARQKQASRRRLAGKDHAQPNWHRFSYNVFRRARFDKYDLRGQYSQWIIWLLGVPLCLFMLWFVWQSIEAIGMFQP